MPTNAPSPMKPGEPKPPDPKKPDKPYPVGEPVDPHGPGTGPDVLPGKRQSASPILSYYITPQIDCNALSRLRSGLSTQN
jgi:hypothetical protein